jgi:hypothetical protein
MELADQLMAQQPVLLDVAAGVGCSCAGVRLAGSPRTARIAVTSLEPPPSANPILEGDALFETSTSIDAPNVRGLLARDPSADERPAEVEERPAAEHTASSVSLLASIETDKIDQESVTADEAPALVLLHPTPEAIESPSIEVPRPVTSPRRIRLFAVTPPRALHALHDRPGFSVRRLERPARVPFMRAASHQALDAPAENLVQSEPTIATTTGPVEAAVTGVGVADQEVERSESVVMRSDGVSVDAPPVGTKVVDLGRTHLPPPAPPRFLTEEPIARVQRAARARIVEHSRPVQPPVTAERNLEPPATTGRFLVRAIVWTIIVLTIFTLAVLSATRGR